MMLEYIIEFSVFLFVFWAAYELFLKKETFFKYNRWYMLFTPIISALIPFLSFNFLEVYAVDAQQWVQLPAVFVGDNKVIVDPVVNQTVSEKAYSVGFFEKYAWWLAYGLGAIISILLLLKKIFRFQQFKRTGIVTFVNGQKIVELSNSKIACTFFKTIYLGSHLAETEKEQILKHEKVHAQENHSLDLLFFEVLKIVFWFNPIIHIYQRQITNLHEFIADAEATKNSDKKSYYESLLNAAFSSEQISFINQFFNHSLIKKRIVMLQKSKSAKLAKFKFLIIVPLILAMLSYVACSDSTNLSERENEIIEVPITSISQKDLPQEDIELINQLEQELQNMDKNGEPFLSIAEAFMIEKDKHIKSKEAYYRFHVFMNWIKKHSKERDIENGEFNEKEFEELWHGLFKPYEEYVAYRKTQPKKTSKSAGQTSNTSIEMISEDPKSDEIDIPFTAVDTAPVYPGCEALDNEAAKKCMTGSITNFVNENFNTKAVKPYARKGTNRIYVRFAITKDGTIDNIEARASAPELAEEAKRVVALLPQMQPGEKDGKPVNVLYSLPIIFQVSE